MITRMLFHWLVVRWGSLASSALTLYAYDKFTSLFCLYILILHIYWLSADCWGSLILVSEIVLCRQTDILDPEGGSQTVLYCSCSCCCCCQFSTVQKSLKAFLIHSGAQRNFAYTFVLTLPTDLPSQIFHLFSH